MKSLFSIICITTFFSFCYFDDIYNLSIKTIEGNKVELSIYRGKKILFVILLLTAEDTTMSVSALETLQKKYANSLVIIGIVAAETGFIKADEIKIKSLYKDMKPGFLISEAIKVKKAAGNEQSSLFQWLTHKDKNRHFDNDAKGVGHMFFVDETGNLYAVMRPGIKLSNPVIERILAKPIANP